MTSEARGRRGRFGQLGPGLIYYIVFLGAPTLLLFAYSFYAVENFKFVADWNVDNYLTVLQSDVYQRLLLRTLVIAAIVAVVTVTLAFFFVFTMTFIFRRWRAAVLFLVLVSLFGGYIVRIYAWRTILGAEGVINGTLLALGIIDAPWRWMLNNPFAVILALTNFLLPIAILPIAASMENLEPPLLEASQDLGAGTPKTLRKVVLPLTSSGVKAAFAFVFIAAAADLATPTLLGGTNTSMVGSAVAELFGRSLNWPLGAALAFTLLVCVAVILGLGHLATRRWFR